MNEYWTFTVGVQMMMGKLWMAHMFLLRFDLFYSTFIAMPVNAVRNVIVM